MSANDRYNAEYRRVQRHLSIGRVHDAMVEPALAAIRSGASVDATLPAYARAAVAAGPRVVELFQEECDAFGYGRTSVMQLAGGAPIDSAARTARAPTSQSLGEQVVSILEQSRGKGDLGDQVVAIIKEQGGL